MKKICIVVGTILVLILMNNVSSEIIMDSSNNIRIENIRFTFANEMYFEYVGVRYDHVLFNSTAFYIDSPNNINITLEHLNQTITGADVGDILVQFDANSTSGNVYFNITGFVQNSNYTILRNNVTYASDIANASGTVSFNYSNWTLSNYTFAIVLVSYDLRIFNPRPPEGALDAKTYQSGMFTCVDIEYSAFDGSVVLTINFTSNSSGVWIQYGSINITDNGTYCVWNNNFSEEDALYFWNVTAENENISAKDSYKFRTGVNILINGKEHEMTLLVYIPLGVIPIYMHKKRRNMF